jgi:NAD(P)-dependent dehydrogenase (short-subunit alcohol dehydrogenase family)
LCCSPHPDSLFIETQPSLGGIVEISLSGKVAVITGASSGIGLAVTRRFLECGAQGVIAVFRRSDIPSELAECKSRFGDKLQIVQGDVADEQTAIDFTETSVRCFGKVDVLVSNAAVSIVKAIHEHTPEEWDVVFNSNVKAMFWASRHIIPVMIRQNGGLILISGSISGEVGIPTQGAYGPSKGALHEMTRQMAVEYAKYHIRVNTIACGTVDTPIVHRSAEASGNPDAYWKMLRSNHPIGRIADVDEVASFYTYMASDRASFFTGSVLMMDGGFTAQ